jgi:hypothetical protein
MLPQRLRAEVKGYMVRDVIVPANSTLEVRAPFFPDWWQVRVQLGNSLSGILKVYPSRNNPSSAHRITGTGETQFPGRDAEQIILLENTSGFAMPLSVTASLGYPPSSVVNPVGIRNYSIQDVTIAGGVTTPVSVGFFPDWWEVRIAPNAPSSGIVKITTTVVAGVAPLQITGTGEVGFPGQPNENSISIQNTGLASVVLSVVASLGYPPTSVVNPVTLAALSGVQILSQTRYMLAGANTNFPLSFAHNHIGRWCLVLFGGDSTVGAVDFNPTAVSVAGHAGVKLTDIGRAGGGEGVACSAWWVDVGADAPAAQVTISCPVAFSNNTYALCLSFPNGVKSGNVNQKSQVVSPLNLTDTGQGVTSIIFGMAVTNSAPLAETTGATVVDFPGNLRIPGVWHRDGSGVLTFNWTTGGAPETEALCAEIALITP